MTITKKISKKVFALILLIAIVSTSFMGSLVTANAASFSISNNGLNIIKEYEGFYKYKYWDYAQYSIGYGSFCYSWEYSNGITKDQAHNLLVSELKSHEKSVNNYISKYKIPINQNQYDALVSFTYNVGSGWMSNSTLSTYLKNGIYNYSANDYAYAFGMWCRAGGSVLQGLVRRRTAEAKLFNTAVNYTVSYNANGGSNAPGNATKKHGEKLTISSTVPTRHGFQFLGWATASNATSAQYSAGSTYTANANLTLYAVWRAQYTVSYNANGGSNAPASVLKNHDANITISNAVPTRNGYKFLGWATSADATKIQYTPSKSFGLNSNTTLYAIWVKLHTLSFSSAAANTENIPANTEHLSGTVKLPSTKPTLIGYEFIGWAVKGNTSTVYKPGSSVKISGDLTLSALWKKYVSVALELDGGKINNANVGDVDKNGVVDREDYLIVLRIVNGDVSASDAKKIDYNRADINADGKINTLDSIAIEDYIKGNISAIPAITMPEKGQHGLLPIPTKEGLYFTGWIDAKGNAVKIGSANVGTLYATWSETPQAGDVDLNGRVDLSDIVAMRSMIMRTGNSADSVDGTVSHSFLAAELDGDDEITLSDIVMLRNLIIG